MLFVCFLLVILQVCLGEDSAWTDLTDKWVDPFTGQRDVAAYIPVDQLTYFGISLNQVIFDKLGYTNETLTSLQNLMSLRYSMFVVDLHWNSFTAKWQLCPAPIPTNLAGDPGDLVNVTWNGQEYRCQPGFTINQFANSINTYLLNSNTMVDANVIQLAFNLKSIQSPTSTNSSSTSNSTLSDRALQSQYAESSSSYVTSGNKTLSESFSALSSHMFTPADLQTYDEQTRGSVMVQALYSTVYPTQNEFLFKMYKRIIPMVLSNEVDPGLYNMTETDQQALFMPGQQDYSPQIESFSNLTFVEDLNNYLELGGDAGAFQEIVLSSHFRMIFDDNDTMFNSSDVSTYLKSGISVVLNASDYDIASANDTIQGHFLEIAKVFSPVSFWSWAPGQPSTNSSTEDYESASADDRTAYQCVSISESGWILLNCYKKLRSACVNELNPFMWELSLISDSYLDLTNSLICRSGYYLGTPRLSVEQFALRALLELESNVEEVWIDVNDITVPGCYVTGGPYAYCPYSRVLTTRNLISSMIPSALISLVLILLIFWERFVRNMPIYTNRKRYWKRRINEYYKENDYEGVPL